jgi:serine/threonine-protein kinase SRPK3
MAYTDIKEANILLPADASVLTYFENQELEEPSPKNEVDGSVICLSRKTGTPKAFGTPVLCDFGLAVALDDDLEHREDIKPGIYRSPEPLRCSGVFSFVTLLESSLAAGVRMMCIRW